MTALKEPLPSRYGARRGSPKTGPDLCHGSLKSHIHDSAQNPVQELAEVGGHQWVGEIGLPLDDVGSEPGRRFHDQVVRKEPDVTHK
jgi:hypothetical protein